MNAKEVSMPNTLAVVTLTVAALAVATPGPLSAQVDRVRQTALARVEKALAMAADPDLLAAVKARNATPESDEEIQRKDREWVANPKAPLRKALTTSPCAQRLRDLTRDDPFVVEAILMDAHGANVCVSVETTDYWQGDEAKFQRTYLEGRPVFVDEPSFDASAGVYAIQLSVLVKDGAAKVGALTLSLRLRREDVAAEKGAR
jgi:hypothetical protein